MNTKDFLVEIGTEELPPKSLDNLSIEFRSLISAQLTDSGLSDPDKNIGVTKNFATPRRLAVVVTNLPEETPKQEIVVWGPPANIAFDAGGKPTKAAESFAKKNGTLIEHLNVESDGNANKLVYRKTGGGESVIKLLPRIVENALKNLSIPKRMRWGTHRVEFIRPVQWVLMLYGNDVVPAKIFGHQSDRFTKGHRFHSSSFGPVAIQNFTGAPGDLENSYVKQLEELKVVASFYDRRGHIRSQVEQLGKKLGGSAVIDADLLDEVTGLVEWPVALAGDFEQRFLAVPQEALISSMKEHQKYFHVLDTNGKLLPHFITISNIESKEPAKVIAGNERVIRPRLSDAAFFYETDLKTPMAQRREKLRSVVFQENLGTIYEKTERLATLAAKIAEQIHADSEKARRAGELSKADLLSNMVGEFDSMQGIAGEYYALHDGEDKAVAKAIREHYLPNFAGDKIASTALGRALAIADKIDTVCSIIAIKQKPSGSGDPYALRRQALGLARTIIEGKLDLDLLPIVSDHFALIEDHMRAVDFRTKQQKSSGTFIGQGDDWNFRVQLTPEFFEFIFDRLRGYYSDSGIHIDQFRAVLAIKPTSLLTFDQKLRALHRFAKLPDAEALAAANKRVTNLLSKHGGSLLIAIDKKLLIEPAERELASLLDDMYRTVTPLFNSHNYFDGLEKLAQLRTAIDRFFAEVMVMAEDEQLRMNRLALLSQLRSLFLEVADISLLAPTTK